MNTGYAIFLTQEIFFKKRQLSKRVPSMWKYKYMVITLQDTNNYFGQEKFNLGTKGSERKH
jgi:hypothetical protein